MVRLSKKFIRRAITGLALLAPVVYLFGSQFFALNGAHGSQIFADDLSDTISVNVNSSNRVYYTGDGGLGSWGACSSLPLIDLQGGDYSYTLYEPDSLVPITGYFFAYFDSDGVFASREESYSISWPLAIPRKNAKVGISLYTNATNGFPAGSLPCTYTIKSPSIIDVSYSDVIFGQFFYSDNFLTEWGRDSISDNPHGFAPFGNMLQFVDENMLHLSDLQIGLMGYGYFYYCAHVLLFVCFFDITTFFLSWILRITHKFGGADYED